MTAPDPARIPEIRILLQLALFSAEIPRKFFSNPVLLKPYEREHMMIPQFLQ
jgi:hypothetical protein